MRTARRNDESLRSFHRQLLAEYNPKYGLDKYVSYFDLKTTISKLEAVVGKIATLQKRQKEEERKIATLSSEDTPLGGLSPPQQWGRGTPALMQPSASSPTNADAGTNPLQAGSPTVAPRLGTPAGEGDNADAAVGGGTTTARSSSRGSDAFHFFGGTPNAKQFVMSTLLALTNDLNVAKDERSQLERSFFSGLQASLVNVKEHVRTLDITAYQKLRALQTRTEDELRSLPRTEMEEVYIQLFEIGLYRDLNVAAFAKILEKFQARCCRDSLELQQKVREADRILSESVIAVPQYDLRQSLDAVASIMSIVAGQSFEQSQECLRFAVAREVANRRRIVPVTSAVHFSRKFSHQSPKSRFPIKLLRGSTHPYIGKTIEKMLEIANTKSFTGKFANGECNVRIDEAVRGTDVFIVQALVANPTRGISLSDAIVELMLMLQCTKLAAPRRIAAVVPYMAYVRHTYSIAAIAEMMVLNGVNHVITCDMQRDQVEGMFGNVPVENITAKQEFSRHLAQVLKAEGHSFRDIVVVSPDSDGVGRAKSWADSFMKAAGLTTPETFVPLCTAVKRITAGASQLDVIGNVSGKLCVIVDSVIDEAINVSEVAKKLSTLGAQRIIAVATHAVFSGSAKENLLRSPIDEIFVSDSIDQDHLLHDAQMARKLRILPLGPLLAEAIQRIHTENSLSTLFEK